MHESSFETLPCNINQPAHLFHDHNARDLDGGDLAFNSFTEVEVELGTMFCFLPRHCRNTNRCYVLSSSGTVAPHFSIADIESYAAPLQLVILLLFCHCLDSDYTFEKATERYIYHNAA